MVITGLMTEGGFEMVTTTASYRDDPYVSSLYGVTRRQLH
jgi:hypothetical protein